MSDPALLALRAALRAGPGVAGSTDYDLNPEARPDPGRPLRAAGVLIAIDPHPATGPASGPATGPEVILTVRSAQLRHHPGQIAFPGGRVDPGDADAVAAALREAEEEIALPRDAVEVIGTLPPHETVTVFRVTPVVGLITRPFVARPEAGEVAEIFRVPLAFLTDPANFRIEGRIWQGRMRRYYTIPYGPYYIWGATARILRSLAGKLEQ